MRDLVVLVADKSMEFALKGALGRHPALGITPVDFHFIQHPHRDGGVRTTGSRILAVESQRFHHALLVLDYEGSGTNETSLDLERRLDQELQASWADRAKAIVIEPELEAWMWGANNALATVLSWPRAETIREWIQTQGFVLDPNGKPLRPKEALEKVFRECRKPKSASWHQKISESISLQRCSDQAYGRLLSQLQNWF